MARRLSKSIQNEIRQITQEFVDQCVNTYRERIHTLRDEPDFVCDNHVRKRVCEPHIMYKLRNSDGLLALKGRNGRYYDFLVEFDPDDFAYGIYFGCRCALNEDDKIARQVEACDKEWRRIEPYVTENLNNAFPDLDFSKRYIPTDNVSDRTYWPFWIRLGEEEDVVEVAATATRIIRNTYAWFFDDARYDTILENGIPEVHRQGREKSHELKVYYTENTYQNILKLLRDSDTYIADADKYFERFLAILEQRDKVERDASIFERCWVTKCRTNEFAVIFSCFCRRITLTENSSVNWKLITPFVMSKTGRSIDGIKSLNIKLENIARNNKADKLSGVFNEAEEMMDEIFQK